MLKKPFRFLTLLLCFNALAFATCVAQSKTLSKSNTGSYKLDTAWNKLANQMIVSQPTGIGIDKDNHIFIFQRTGRNWTEPFPDSLISVNTIFEIDPETGKQINAWGANHFVMPHGLMVDNNNNIWVTDVALHQVFKFSHDGKLLMKLGIAREGGNDPLHFNRPTDVTVDKDGSFYVSDGYRNSRVVKFSADGKHIKEWGSFGKGPGQFNIPHGLAIDSKENIFVADRQNNRIQVFDKYGKYLYMIKNPEEVQQLPSIVVDNQNRIFAIDYDPSKNLDSVPNGSTFFECGNENKTNIHFGATGLAKRTSSWFHDIAVDRNGCLYVCDITNLKVLKFKRTKK